jgi:DNA-binding NtrC family response regulator
MVARPSMFKEDMRMNLVLLDESKKRKQLLEPMLQERGYTVRICSGSNDFIDSLDKIKPDRVLIDFEAWKHGRAIYAYMKIGKKIEQIPVTFYNAPEKFAGITERQQHPGDKVLKRQTTVEAIVGAL